MMSPELNFVYYSFISNCSEQICLLDKHSVSFRNFETDKVTRYKMEDFLSAIERKELRFDRRQNEMFKFLNKKNNVEPIPAFHERYKVSPKGSVGANASVQKLDF